MRFSGRSKVDDQGAIAGAGRKYWVDMLVVVVQTEDALSAYCGTRSDGFDFGWAWIGLLRSIDVIILVHMVTLIHWGTVVTTNSVHHKRKTRRGRRNHGAMVEYTSPVCVGGRR